MGSDSHASSNRKHHGMMHAYEVSGLLDRTLDLGLVFILEFVLIAHHQVRMRHAKLRREKKQGGIRFRFGIYSLQRDGDVRRCHLEGQGEVAGLGVSDDAGGHGRLAAPAPLQVAHGVLVQVARHHGAGAWPDTTRGELRTALCGHKAENMITKTEKYKKTQTELLGYLVRILYCFYSNSAFVDTWMVNDLALEAY